MPSASLIPHDQSLLFTVAGMVPFKPYFTEEEKSPYQTAVSIQKCFRAPDIEIIGTTQRHLTFFEMMGNFSFGQYFKEGAIANAWGLITEGFGLDPDRLWITVHHSDDEAADIWRDKIGISPDRIQRLGEDNFWSMGEVGPCGPCSEIFFDKGPEFGADGGPAFGGDDRFIEFWNLVFMQYEKGPHESLTDLPKKNIDTGAGFERVLSILNGVESVFATDLFAPLLQSASKIVGKAYGVDADVDIAIRRIAEHGRAMTMLVSDGVLPSNEGRGYVLRRIIRRAILASRRHGSNTDIAEPLVQATIEKLGEAYPVLVKDRDLIVDVLQREEERFSRTLRNGMNLLEEEQAAVLSRGLSVFPGDTAFKLHDTHGFPVELTEEVVGEAGLEVDKVAFQQAMNAQREQARSKAKTLQIADDSEYKHIIERSGTTNFVGRGLQNYSVETEVVAVLQAPDGTHEIFLTSSPFYAESGGQIGDTGAIVTESGRFEVMDTQNVVGGLFAHRGKLTGELFPGQVAIATIDSERREAIRRNHTSTHLLHSALRSILGEQVRQQGSYVGPDRLRFDFSYQKPVRREELEEVLEIANGDVVSNDGVETIETSKASAEAMGAIAFFGDKYGETVRVVRAGSHSLEFCGGTHVDSLGSIGSIQILSEASIGSNTRRIEAVSGAGAFRRAFHVEETLRSVSDLLKTSMDEVVPSLEKVLERQHQLEKAISALRLAQLDGMVSSIHKEFGTSSVILRLDGFDGEGIRHLVKGLQDKGHPLVVIAGSIDEKVAFGVGTDGSRDAREVVRSLASIVGGGGGGSPTLAVAGGRDVKRIDDLLVAAKDL